MLAEVAGGTAGDKNHRLPVSNPTSPEASFRRRQLSHRRRACGASVLPGFFS